MICVEVFISIDIFLNIVKEIDVEVMPPIIMSSLDQARLELLLASDSYRNLPGVDLLSREIERAKVLEPREIPPNLVTMNSTVRFIDGSNDAEFELTLVYPKDAGAEKTISILAPVGSALLGLSVNQTISWEVPGVKKAQLRVLEVTRQPEALGHFHL